MRAQIQSGYFQTQIHKEEEKKQFAQKPAGEHVAHPTQHRDGADNECRLSICDCGGATSADQGQRLHRLA